MIPFYDKKLLQKLKTSMVSIERGGTSLSGPQGETLSWGVIVSRDGDLIVPTRILVDCCRSLVARLSDGTAHHLDCGSPVTDGPVSRVGSAIPRKKAIPVSMYRSLPRFPVRCQIMPLSAAISPLEQESIVGAVLEPPAENWNHGRALGLRPARSLPRFDAALIWTDDWRIVGAVDFRLQEARPRQLAANEISQSPGVSEYESLFEFETAGLETAGLETAGFENNAGAETSCESEAKSGYGLDSEICAASESVAEAETEADSQIGAEAEAQVGKSGCPKNLRPHFAGNSRPFRIESRNHNLTQDQGVAYCIPAATSRVFGFCKIISFSELHKGPRLQEISQPGKKHVEPRSKVVSLFEFRENQSGRSPRKSMESYMEGLLYLEKGAGERALDCFRMAANKDPFQCNTQFMIGYCLSRLDNHDEALEAYHLALISEPDDRYMVQDGAAYVREYLTEAIETYRKMQEKVSADWSLLFDQGIINERAGFFSESAAAFKLALKLEPTDAETWNRLGMSLFNAGLHDESIAAYEKALEFEPMYPAVYDNLGVVMGRLGRVEEEIGYYRKALELDPGDAIAHYNLGLAQYNQGQFWDAIKSYREAVNLEPDNAATLTNLGLVYDELGMFDEAALRYASAIELDPYLVEPRNNLGVIYENLGRRDEARTAYTEAVQVAPDYPAAHYNLGVLCFEDGEVEKAHDFFRTVVKLEPENPNAHFYLAIIAFKNNDLGTAMKEQTILSSLDPSMARELSTKLLDS
jgi:Flp pilus assembly protein TadD